MQNSFSQPSLASNPCDDTEPQPTPSTAIDAALCDLVQRVINFSDDDFDAEWFSLSDTEVEGLVVQVLQHLTDTLDGKQLSGYLLMLLSTAVGSDPSSEAC